GREMRGRVRAIAPEVPRTIFDERPAPVFRLNPPSHDVVIARRWLSLPVEEVIAVLRRLGQVHVEGHVGVGAFFDRDPRSADLYTQLLGVEYIVFVDRELAGVLSLLDDVGDNLDVSQCRILAAGTGLAPLAEIARLETGLEDDLGRGGAGNTEQADRH